MPPAIRVGIDTGGTFTDVVAVDERTGRFVTAKTPSTPADPAQGFMTGLHQILDRIGAGADAVETISHGTTVATNRLLEGKIDDLGFITTEGYEHVLPVDEDDAVAAVIADAAGFDRVLTLDGGGTSTDVTVGSGGGSIAWISPERILKVGPRSAGAEPGPMCYGTGGREPTVTDAHVLLGRLPPGLLGGAITLEAPCARHVHRRPVDSVVLGRARGPRRSAVQRGDRPGRAERAARGRAGRRRTRRGRRDDPDPHDRWWPGHRRSGERRAAGAAGEPARERAVLRPRARLSRLAQGWEVPDVGWL